eukprot:6839451-Ditylum_brightwellii.AAC.1
MQILSCYLNNGLCVNEAAIFSCNIVQHVSYVHEWTYDFDCAELFEQREDDSIRAVIEETFSISCYTLCTAPWRLPSSAIACATSFKGTELFSAWSWSSHGVSDSVELHSYQSAHPSLRGCGRVEMRVRKECGMCRSDAPRLTIGLCDDVSVHNTQLGRLSEHLHGQFTVCWWYAFAVEGLYMISKVR